MKDLKIKEGEPIELSEHIFFTFQNAKQSFILACPQTIFLSYFKIVEPTKKEQHLFFKTLAHCFSFELVRALKDIVSGGVFHVSQISLTPDTKVPSGFKTLEAHFQDDSGNPYQISLFANPTLAAELTDKFNTEYRTLVLDKYTSLVPLTKKVNLISDDTLTFDHEVIHLFERTEVLKCSVVLERTILHFYFPQSFLAQVKESHFHKSFVSFLNKELHCPVRLAEHSTVYLKNCDLAPFHLKTDEHANVITFYVEHSQRKFVFSLLEKNGFKALENVEKRNFSAHTALQFPVEVGVTYCHQDELQKLEEGDIILFDKDAFSDKTTELNHVVVNLNGVFFKASVEKNTCRLVGTVPSW